MSESQYTSDNVNNICKLCTFPKSFWHTNHTIFDVNIHYLGEFIAMISFSKNKKGNFWAQSSTFWDDWNPSFTDSQDIFLAKAIQREKLIKYLTEKATIIFQENE